MFVQSQETAIGATAFRLLFLSRRSCSRQGTRFTVRGVDENGNVANFAESEQIVVRRDSSMSAYVQVRGSVPVFWQQCPTLKYTPKIEFTAPAPQNDAAMAKHFRELNTLYGPVVAVNLIDQKKQEMALGTVYRETLARLPEAKARYLWFDFHSECKNMKYENLQKLVDACDDDFTRHGFFSTTADGKVSSLQRGVIRTNCVDNLDRTNVVQSLFARRSLLAQLQEKSDNVLSSPFPEFERVFKNMWADHANALSRFYSGTGALKVDFTRTGKRTLLGALSDGSNSLKRYFLNNFYDGERQDGYDLFLGVYRADPSSMSVYAESPGRCSAYTRTALFKVVFVLLVLLAVVASLFKFTSKKLVNRPRLVPHKYYLPSVELSSVLSPEGIAALTVRPASPHHD
jgi:hypothetical protein